MGEYTKITTLTLGGTTVGEITAFRPSATSSLTPKRGDGKIWPTRYDNAGNEEAFEFTVNDSGDALSFVIGEKIGTLLSGATTVLFTEDGGSKTMTFVGSYLESINGNVTQEAGECTIAIKCASADGVSSPISVA